MRSFKTFLTERASEVLWHILSPETTMGNIIRNVNNGIINNKEVLVIYDILNSGHFILSSTMYQPHEIKLSRGYSHFFSTTRSLNSYYIKQALQNREGDVYFLFRIDGNKVNNKYKTIPVNYDYTSNDNLSLLRGRGNSEAEDRIVTNKTFIQLEDIVSGLWLITDVDITNNKKLNTLFTKIKILHSKYNYTFPIYTINNEDFPNLRKSKRII